MKVCISLNLFTIFINASVGRLFCFLDDSLKLSKVIFSKLAETQLNSEQIEGIDKSENLGMVLCRPSAQIETARRPTLNHPDLLKTVECIPYGGAAHIKTPREIFFAKSLVGNKFPFFYSFKDSENNPIGESAINGFLGEARCFV